MSIGPKAFSVSLTALAQSASFRTLAAMPAPPMDFATRATWDSVRATTATRAHSLARASAMPRPMPRVAAVTSATLPAMP
jgi:hypothetical protein